jgi:molybdopterin-guanine dinucleotide biosynthesis protein A
LLFQRRVVSGDPVRLDPRPVQVVGRERLLTDLHVRLSRAQGVGVVALSGLGGVGKTTTASEYAYRHLAEYKIVWLFHAEQATDLMAQFHELAQLLDAPENASPVAAVHAVLGTYPGRWLLVFDNAKDHAAVRSWLPARGAGHVLVTTQDGVWPREQAMEVSALDAQAAVEFLLNRTMSRDAKSAHAIAHELGLLPLALEQAAAFVETTGRSLEQYRELLRTDHSALLKRGAPAAHVAPVVATLSLALTELETVSPGSLVLLRIAAFLAPEDIPFRLLLPENLELPSTGLDARLRDQVQELCTEPLALDDAVAGLRRLSLIGPPSQVFSVHRLVQAVARDRIAPEQQQAWRAVAVELIEAAVPAGPELPASWPLCRLLLPHAALILEPLNGLMWDLVTALGNSGDYATARTWFQTLVQAHEDSLGPEHPDTLSARHSFADWTGQAGDAVTARDMLEKLLPISERLLGAEHPATLIIRHNFAGWTGEAGDAVAARDMFEKLLPIRERLLGAEHPDTLSTRYNFADWTGKAGGTDLIDGECAAT